MGVKGEEGRREAVPGRGGGRAEGVVRARAKGEVQRRDHDGAGGIMCPPSWVLPSGAALEGWVLYG